MTINHGVACHICGTRGWGWGGVVSQLNQDWYFRDKLLIQVQISYFNKMFVEMSANILLGIQFANTLRHQVTPIRINNRDYHYGDVIWARWRLKSPASPLFTQPFIQVQFKEIIKAPRHWPWCGEFTGDRWILRTNGQLRGKCFHLMTSSCTGAGNGLCLLEPNYLVYRLKVVK